MTDRDQFIADYDVPRGTALLFDRYAELLIDWQSRMNLVAPSTLDHIWNRHFADSAQLTAIVTGDRKNWLDIGSGAGFPGLVIAILTQHQVTLAESIAKKCRFLEAVVNELELDNVEICNQRVEALARGRFEVISARACAPLTRLFGLGLPAAAAHTRWILLKGATVDQELEEARLHYDFSARLVPSRTDSRGRIIVASNVHPGHKW